MKTTIALDASNRIVLSKELRRAAGIPRRQKLLVSATPGRIVLEMAANASGHIIKRGKLKVWTGAVPATPLEEAVEQSRHYTR
jgi:bifunctional DNA-binding transcriptional regulator/antitoxin component of YhaV-PrlF toxin-antitoxin module